MSFDTSAFWNLHQKLLSHPYTSIDMGGYSARIIIPEHDRIVNANYNNALKNTALTEDAPKTFEHFGVEIAFHQPTELALYSDEYHLDKNLKPLIDAFGPVLIKNA